MAEFKLGTVNIFEIGDFLSKKLVECGVEGTSVLTIPVSSDEFKKVDEDLFYRMNEKGTPFIPSEEEIIVNLKGLEIILKEKR